MRSVSFHLKTFCNWTCINPGCSQFIIMASLVAQLVKNPPAVQRLQFNSCVGKIRWRRDILPTPVFLGFPCGSDSKESIYNVDDLSLIPGLGRSPGEGKGYSFQYSGLENSMDSIVYGVAKRWTRLSDVHLTQFTITQISHCSHSYFKLNLSPFNVHTFASTLCF